MTGKSQITWTGLIQGSLKLTIMSSQQDIVASRLHTICGLLYWMNRRCKVKLPLSNIKLQHLRNSKT